MARMIGNLWAVADDTLDEQSEPGSRSQNFLQFKTLNPFILHT